MGGGLFLLESRRVPPRPTPLPKTLPDAPWCTGSNTPGSLVHPSGSCVIQCCPLSHSPWLSTSAPTGLPSGSQQLQPQPSSGALPELSLCPEPSLPPSASALLFLISTSPGMPPPQGALPGRPGSMNPAPISLLIPFPRLIFFVRISTQHNVNCPSPLR